MAIETDEERNLTVEQEMLDYVERLGCNGYSGRFALHLQFSALHAMYQKPDYLRIAVRIFAEQVAHYGGRYYQLSNEDVVYVAREATGDALDAVIGRIRLLFSEDPLAASASEAAAFHTRYELDADYYRFLEKCRMLLRQADERRRHDAALEQIVLRPDPRAAGMQELGALEERMAMFDISSIIRKQSVCALSPSMQPEAMFDETFISIADLRTLTGLQLNPSGNRWLFQYLTQALDRHMLGYLVRDDIAHSRPISLNLNVGTILTSEFQRFNDAITQRVRQTLVIEFNKIDVFADMGAFLFVRDYLRERGIRTCLDGLNNLTLPYYDRKRLGFDLIKMHWSPESLNEAQPDSLPQLRRLVMESEQSRVVLCHCDSPRAIQVGQNLGIVMFQGREIDRMLMQIK